jgi:hypothetical protein
MIFIEIIIVSTYSFTTALGFMFCGYHMHKTDKRESSNIAAAAAAAAAAVSVIDTQTQTDPIISVVVIEHPNSELSCSKLV